MRETIFKYLTLVLLFILPLNLSAQIMEEVRVWQNILSEDDADDNNDAVMYIYYPEVEVNNGSAIIICPGGSYKGLALNHEGHDVAKWLASEGTTAAVLKYRLPKGNYKIPISDVREATRYLRRHSDSLSIKSDKIGVMGFSAGGHLASTHITQLDDSLSRPNFGVLFYPVITSDERYSHKGSFQNLLGDNPSQELRKSFSGELNVSAETPPTLLFHSDDDRVLPINSALFYEALKRNSVPSSMYIFPDGGHGWGFRDSFAYHEVWKSLLIDWLNKLGNKTTNE